MAGIEDVARLAEVSPITVSRVIHNRDHVSSTTRARVQAAIAELNYIPNAVARGLRQSRSGMIAFIITDISSPLYTAVAHGGADAARENGLSLLFGNTSEDGDVELDYLRVMGERRVEGLVWAPTSVQAVTSLRRLVPSETPVVLFDRAFPGTEVDVVRCDTESAVSRLCQHLLDLGHRRIAIVGGLPAVTTWHERVNGYCTALAAAGFPIDQELIVPGDYKRSGGVQAMRVLLRMAQLPDVIIAANSQVALGVMDQLVANGIRVPEDVGLASVDDPLPQSDFWPRVTVVEQPGYEMGKAAVELLASRLRPPTASMPRQELVFNAKLNIGTSCGEQMRPGALGLSRTAPEATLEGQRTVSTAI